MKTTETFGPSPLAAAAREWHFLKRLNELGSISLGRDVPEDALARLERMSAGETPSNDERTPWPSPSK